MTTYATEDRAFARVETLKQYGIWPAIICVNDRWRLTYDPDVHTRSGVIVGLNSSGEDDDR